jgi:phage replication-related protein YjqB (UPF0714/DUF867 family)
VLREFLEREEVTELCRLRGRFGIMAYHGGNLERTTDAVADEIARRTGSSFYGIVQASPHRHHIASTYFDPDHSRALANFLGHVDVVITIHGYGRRRLWRHLLLGGQNRRLARHVALHLRKGLPRRYRVLDDLDTIPKELRGQHPSNPVNRPPSRGVQIELPPTIRWNFSEWGWSDHGGVSRSADVGHLIDALSQAVTTWTADDAGG